MGRARQRRWRRLFIRAGLVLLLLFAVIQLVPYGRDHSSPPVTLEPKWVSAQTRALAVRACFDCHSNLTTWRWYSSVAPASWLVQRDVDGGRGQFNFSEWNRPQDVSAGDLADSIRGGSMPPWFYVLLHAKAKLNTSEKDALIAGLNATFAKSPPKGGG